MNEDTFTLTLGPAELAFVVSALGAAPRLLDDPFAGWPPERTETALRQAQEALAAHQYIQAESDGSMALDTAVAALVGALAFAEVALTVTRVMDAEEQPAIRRIHFAAGLIVEQEQQRDESHSLTAVRDGEIVAWRLKKYLRLASQPAPPAQSWTFPASGADEARYVAAVEGERACAEFLAGAGAPAAVASSLAQAMASPVCQSALLALGWEGPEAQRLDSLTLLEGRHGLWLLHPLAGDDEPRLEALPCDAAGAASRVEELVRLFLGHG
jgi:hypothetical protein